MTYHRTAAFSWSMALRFNRWLLWMLCLSVTLGFDLGLHPSHRIVQAQITPDQTLGRESSVVVPDSVQGMSRNRIEGGAVRANVLFHSFDEFNVKEATATYFANPDSISTILSRVTGTDHSEIMGRLGVLGNANLFLLNPNGIIFGPDASLDIHGSFLATTADEFTFPDDHSFSAIAPNAPPLLSLNVPIGLQYGTGTSGAVVNAGSLAVKPGNTLTLTGSSVIHTGSLTAPSGDVAIAAIAQPTHLQFDRNGHLESVTPTRASSPVPQINPSPYDWLTTNGLGNLGIAQSTGGIASAGGTPIPETIVRTPGNILITGIVNTSHLNPESMGGRVQILGDRISLIDNTQINTSGVRGGGIVHIGGGYQGNGIGLNASQTIIGPQVTLQADALTHGSGGDVIVWADDRTQFYGSISAQGGANGGDGGFVEVSGKDHLAFGGDIDLSAPLGQSGRLLLDPENIIVVGENGANDAELNDGQLLEADGGDRPFTITEETLENISGTATITLEATNDVIIQNLADDELELTGDSSIQIVADADGDGRGNFTMSDRQDKIFSNGADIVITGAVLQPGQLNSEGGNITLSASDRIQLLPGSEINSGQFDGSADDTEFKDFTQDFAGDITLTAGNEIQLQGTSITADGGGSGAGAAGNIRLTSQAGSIRITQNSEILSEVLSQGFAGSIRLNANNEITLRNSSISSNASNDFGDGEGGAGVIRLLAIGDIRITNGSIQAESVRTAETENRGRIAIASRQGALRLRRATTLSTRADVSGFAGAIDLRARQGSIRISDSDINSNFDANDFDINDSSEADGGAGKIDIVSRDSLRIINDSTVSARSFSVVEEGSSSDEDDASGSIFLRSITDNIVIENSRVATSTEGDGSAGEIEVRASQGLLRLTGNEDTQDTNTEGLFTEANTGLAGDIRIIVEALRIEDGARISARTRTGQAGDITINDNDNDNDPNPDMVPAEQVTLEGDRSRITARARGAGGFPGEIIINANALRVTNNAQITAANRSGNRVSEVGNIVLEEVASLEVLSGGQISVRTASGIAGEVDINQNSRQPVETLMIRDDQSRITARATRQDGDAGSVNINARNITVSDRAQITAANISSDLDRVESNIRLDNVEHLTIRNGGEISVQTSTTTAGNVTINQTTSQPAETVSLQGNNSRITARAIGQNGASGRVEVNARNITVSDHAEISAENRSRQGNRSNNNSTPESTVTLTNVDTLTVLNGGQINVRTRTGTAGNVEINPMGNNPAQALRVSSSGSQITARATGVGGDAGQVEINARNIEVSDRAEISAANVSSDDDSINSSINLRNVERLDVLSGGQISVSTQRGSARNIDITAPSTAASPSVLVDDTGSSITAQATGNSQSATAGNIGIETNTLRVRNGGSITVSSPTGIAGNLDLDIAYVILDDGLISAEIGSTTASDRGANITVTGLDALLMRNNSVISASATGGARGGNLTFGSPNFPAILIGAPSSNNSDLIAIANQGQGGTITLSVAQIEGFTVRDTPLVRNNLTNDISVSSTAGASGTIAIDTPAINPLGDTIDLPEGLVTTTPLDTLCSTQGQSRSEFIQIGRGGVPRQPDDVIGPLLSPIPWVQLEQDGSYRYGEEAIAPPRQTHSKPSPPSLIEAQGLRRNQDGTLILTAQNLTTAAPQAPSQSTLGTCHP